MATSSQAVEVALLKARVDLHEARHAEILEEIRKINKRLEEGDKRFEAADIMAAENRGMRKVIMALGTMVFTGLMALGGWLLSQLGPISKAIAAVISRGP